MMRIHVLIIMFGLLTLVGQPISASAQEQTSLQEPTLRLVRADNAAIVLELTTPTYELVDDTMVDAVGNRIPCQRIRVPQLALSGTDGVPHLPSRMTLLAVPPTGAIDLTVEAVETATLPAQIAICPAPTAVSQQGVGDVVRFVEQDVAPNAAIYAQDTYYPAAAARMLEAGFMRSQRLARVELFPFQVNPVSGQVTYHRRLRVELTFPKEATTQASAVAESSAFEDTLAELVLNYSSASQWRMPPQGTAVTGWSPPPDAYRVAVAEEGIYAITYAELSAAGYPVDTVNPAFLRLLHDDQELAIRVEGSADGSFDPGDLILFYGQPSTDRYARHNIYWLTDKTAIGEQVAGRRMGVRAGVASRTAQPATLTWQTLHHEENIAYVSSLPMRGDYDHWYGKRVLATGAGQPGHQDILLRLDNPVTSGNSAVTLNVTLAGSVEGTHHLRLFFNGPNKSTKWQLGGAHLPSGAGHFPAGRAAYGR